MFNIQKMMQQAQEVQKQMGAVQEELEGMTFTGEAGGGAVTVTSNGKLQFSGITISQEALEDKDMLEDMILAALKDVNNKVANTTQEKMSAVTSQLNLPPGINIPGLS